jgi:cobalt-zinc-cadmium efflux system membrane fusion protein
MNLKLSTKYLGAFAVLAAYVVILISCQSSHEASSADQPANFERQGNLIVIPEGSPLRQQLKFETAQAESVKLQLAAPAVVEANPDRQARIYPPLAGRIARLDVRLGDAVIQEQLLATLQSPDYMAAQSDFTKAKSALLLATRTWERQRDLLEHKIVAQKDVEQAQKDLEAVQSDLESVTARLRTFGLDPEKDKLGQPLEIRSPISGRVVELAATPGEFRNDSNTPLMTVADLSTVWLTASVQEKDIRHLARGQQVNAVSAAYPGEVLRGKVLFVGDLLDPETRSIKVRMAFPNPDGRFKPGMFMTMNFEGFSEKVVTVSTTAVVQIGASSFVFEQVKPWTLAPREVVLGEQRGERTIIKQGLNPGATILAREGVLFQ